MADNLLRELAADRLAMKFDPPIEPVPEMFWLDVVAETLSVIDPDGKLSEARRIVDEQAEDEALWFVAQTAPEAYLQQELRRLHAVVEDA